MNTNMTGLDDFQKSPRPCALNESSLSIERVKRLYIHIIKVKVFGT